ncbi:MAG: acyl-CoA thioesterase [Candidatus Krumholzibacteriota bacterium]|nr:acyl-CoA thioesterase [Candidatus Krumholzibacteriota bacterium]
MGMYTTDITVRYAETDRMGVAHHSSYLLWFELARTGLLREAGHAYRDLEADGVLLPVIEYACRLFKGADYDDTIRIETQVEELRSRSVTFRYRLFNDGVRIAEGSTRHLCVTRDNRPRRLPESVAEAIASYR